ncbi:MAG: DUF2851 family protein [Candidatus Aureabacteria bacterium]|nr:DUF2851 family protein [Candidatus Auribacterota bacterium]
MSERFVRCLWYAHHRYLKEEVTSLDGKSVSIISPGHWNNGRGPDFIGGVFRLGRVKRVCGDVEVHRCRGDWRAHGHKNDPAFSGVKLHVFLFDADGNRRGEQRAGRNITEICLLDQTRRNLHSLLQGVKPERYPYATDALRGRCSRVLHDLGGERIMRLLRSAGEARLAEKSLTFCGVARSAGEEQAIYQSVLESLGYAAHKNHFLQLSRRIPWNRLREIVCTLRDSTARMVIETSLLGTAGLIPSRPEASWDRETKSYWRECHTLWERIHTAYSLRCMKSSYWKSWGSRPANSPCRRISGISVLLARAIPEGLAAMLHGLEPRDDTDRIEEQLRQLLACGREGYWQKRYAWGRHNRGPAARLLGKNRIAEMIANVILPFLCYEGHGNAARELLHRIPSVAANSVTKLMSARLFGRPSPLPGLNRVSIQQGLIHMHKRFCGSHTDGCTQCLFPELLSLTLMRRSAHMHGP